MEDKPVIREFADEKAMWSCALYEDGSLFIGQASEQVELSPSQVEELKRVLNGR